MAGWRAAKAAHVGKDLARGLGRSAGGAPDPIDDLLAVSTLTTTVERLAVRL
jgi:hypothetical protein